MKVKLNRQFLKNKLWGKNLDAVDAEKKEVTLTTNLRTIHSSWMLWLVAVAFTVITSPLVMNLYGGPGSGFIITGIIIFAAVVGEKKLGKRIANTYFDEIRTNETYTLNKFDVWVARISLVIILVILIMDVASVASESYNSTVIYFVSVSLLVITTLLLALPIVMSHKNKKEEKGEDV